MCSFLADIRVGSAAAISEHIEVKMDGGVKTYGERGYSHQESGGARSLHDLPDVITSIRWIKAGTMLVKIRLH